MEFNIYYKVIKKILDLLIFKPFLISLKKFLIISKKKLIFKIMNLYKLNNFKIFLNIMNLKYTFKIHGSIILYYQN